jgi:hypothetical protein
MNVSSYVETRRCITLVMQTVKCRRDDSSYRAFPLPYYNWFSQIFLMMNVELVFLRTLKTRVVIYAKTLTICACTHFMHRLEIAGNKSADLISLAAESNYPKCLFQMLRVKRKNDLLLRRSGSVSISVTPAVLAYLLGSELPPAPTSGPSATAVLVNLNMRFKFEL